MTAEWEILQDLIDGVKLREVRNVPTDSGTVTELYRSDWRLDAAGVDQVFLRTLNPGAISAWHVHLETIDRLTATLGLVKVVLYDARPSSPTHKRLNVFRLGPLRPGLLVVPPGVWHGVENVGDGPAHIVNAVDYAYQHTAPDHWALPPDSPAIPYRWSEA